MWDGTSPCQTAPLMHLPACFQVSTDDVSGDFVDHDAFIWSHYPVSVSLSLLIVSFQVRGTSVLTTDDCINRTIALRRESEAGAQESKITNSGYKWILGKSSSLQLLLHKVR